ncbi:MAG: YibE/F family protein [Coriobacteriales bacterium]|nr:YibE/F family protein [Coriobacteriales bacterium]
MSGKPNDAANSIESDEAAVLVHAPNHRNSHIEIAFFLVVILIMCAAVYFGLHSNIEYSPYYSPGVSFPIGRVVEIVSDQTEIDEFGLHRGRQDLRVELLSTEKRGQIIDVINILSIDHSVYLQIGQRIVVYYDQQPGDDYYFASVQGVDRSWTILGLIALFFCLLVAVGGKTGLRSAFGLAFTFIVVIFFLIPLIIQGAPPVWLSLATTVGIIVVSLLSMLGFSKKAYVGMLSTTTGVLLCCLFYTLISQALHITGYNISDIDSLVVIAYNTNIKVGDLLFCGVLLASLGAVIDVSVSVASSVAELSETNALASFHQLFRSGVRIGRDIIGATANTLILAFTGSFFTTLVILRIYEIQFNHLINLDEIAVELLQALASSSALILCAPITALIAARVFSRRKQQQSLPAFSTSDSENRDAVILDM